MPFDLFTFHDVSYHYVNARPALSEINLRLFQAESMAVLGANGSGKSTILKLMDGIIFPDHGEITAFGNTLGEKELNRNPYEFRRKVGFLFQDSDAQLFCTTVYDEAAFAPLQMGLTQTEVKRRVEETLQDFGLWELRDRPPYQLSGGEKKKVALASVLIYRPQVLLLDEPTNGLDPRSKRWLLTKLLDLNRHHDTTLVMATHDLDAARFLANRVLIMNEQHQVETLGPMELLDDQVLLSKVNLI